MATRRQRERKARRRAFHNAVARNFMYHGRLGSWDGGVLLDEILVPVTPDKPTYLPTVGGLGGYYVSLVERPAT